VHGRAVPPTTTPSDSRIFETDAMDRDIAGQYLGQFGERVDVRCPRDQPVVVGRIFTCDIAGRSEKIEVTVTSAAGDYTWKPVG
jgi:hypothetical protein